MIVALVEISLAHPPLPEAPALPESVSEESLEVAAIGPIVLPITVRFSIQVIALVNVPVLELLYTLAMFQGRFELALIPIT